MRKGHIFLYTCTRKSSHISVRYYSSLNFKSYFDSVPWFWLLHINITSDILSITRKQEVNSMEIWNYYFFPQVICFFYIFGLSGNRVNDQNLPLRYCNLTLFLLTLALFFKLWRRYTYFPLLLSIHDLLHHDLH